VEYGSQDRNDKGENRRRATQEPKPISFEGKGPGEKIMGDHIQKRKDKSSSPAFRANYDKTFRGKDANSNDQVGTAPENKKAGVSESGKTAPGEDSRDQVRQAG
jgi:hypothetical protein